MITHSLLIPLLVTAVSAAAEAPPNIVLILADDLGYGDVHCFNPEKGKIPTPNIDRLAAEGMRFTDCHSPSSVCSPTRYGLLTGRYSWRTHLQRGVLKPYDPPLIKRNRLTLASFLRRQGYATACIGKWHLGWNWPRRDGEVVFDQPITEGPTTRGFDYYFGTDVPNYPPYCFIENDRTVGQPTGYKETKNLDGRPGPELPGWKREEILPTLVGKSVEYIRQRAADKQPFFLYFPLTSPHEPIAPTEQFRGRSGISPVADFIMETDWAVGQVLDALARNGLSDNTLVVFTADNGHATYTEPDKETLVREGNVRGHYPSGPWRGIKSDTWEGGHRVAMIVRWPGKVRPGTSSNRLVCLTDWMATIADLFREQLPDTAGEDSSSFLPTLRGKASEERDAVILHSCNGRFAIRDGYWKLILCPGSGGFGGQPGDEKARKAGLPPVQLYNLHADPAEKHNLQAANPQLVEKLTRQIGQAVAAGRTTQGAPQPNDTDVDWRYPPPAAAPDSRPATRPANKP